MNERDRHELCQRTAQLLAERSHVLRFSLPVTLIGIISVALFALQGAPLAALLLAGAAALIGPVNLRLLMHISFDARVFSDWAHSANINDAIASFDRTMTTHFAMPPSKAARPLALRTAGARKLLKLAFCVATAQLVLLLLAWGVFSLR